MSSRSVPSLRYDARREAVERMAPSYQQASQAQKTLLLNLAVAVTGYARNMPFISQSSVRGQTHDPTPTHATLWARGTTSAVAGLEGRQAHLCSTPHPLSADPGASPGAAWTSACDERDHCRTLLAHSPQASFREALHDPSRISAQEQVPVRTFQQWNEAQPGFLEADLVGHHGGHTQGCFLYTLTLTDIATGWAECLPLLYKSPEAVLVALQQARELFPFPILGLDTDNGGEFINETLLAYCEGNRSPLHGGAKVSRETSASWSKRMERWCASSSVISA